MSEPRRRAGPDPAVAAAGPAAAGEWMGPGGAPAPDRSGRLAGPCRALRALWWFGWPGPGRTGKFLPRLRLRVQRSHHRRVSFLFLPHPGWRCPDWPLDPTAMPALLEGLCTRGRSTARTVVAPGATAHLVRCPRLVHSPASRVRPWLRRCRPPAPYRVCLLERFLKSRYGPALATARVRVVSGSSGGLAQGQR